MCRHGRRRHVTAPWAADCGWSLPPTWCHGCFRTSESTSPPPRPILSALLTPWPATITPTPSTSQHTAHAPRPPAPRPPPTKPTKLLQANQPSLQLETTTQPAPARVSPLHTHRHGR